MKIMLSSCELARVLGVSVPLIAKYLRIRLLSAEQQAHGTGYRHQFSLKDAVAWSAAKTLRDAGFSVDETKQVCAWIVKHPLDLLTDETHCLLLAVGGSVPFDRLISRGDLSRLDLFGVLTSGKPIAVIDLAATHSAIIERLKQIRRTAGQENSSTTTSTLTNAVGRSGCDAGSGGGSAF